MQGKRICFACEHLNTRAESLEEASEEFSVAYEAWMKENFGV